MELPGLRAEFPVFERLAYLNAGTDGPLPARAVQAAAAELEREAADGRTTAHFERRAELSGELRALYAAALGCETTDLALTTSTSEGLAQVIGGLELGRGDEIVTSDEEHPGLQGALVAARELKGVSIEAVPFAEVANAVGPRTRLVACSHVGWMSGSLAPAALAEVDVPVLLDGAQGVGAVPVDVTALGCDAYAGAGQKWLCGPDGTGMLYVSPGLRERVQVARRGYPNLADPNEGLEAQLHEDARRFDSLSAERRDRRLRAGGDEAAGVRRLARGARARENARRAAGGAAERAGYRGCSTRARAPWSPLRAPTPKPSAHGSPRAAWCCVTSRDDRGCAPRSGRGTTRATWNG